MRGDFRRALIVGGEEIENRFWAAIVHADGEGFLVGEKKNDRAVFEGDEADFGESRRLQRGKAFFQSEFDPQRVVGRAQNNGWPDGGGFAREFGPGDHVSGFYEFSAFAAAGHELAHAFLQFRDLLTR